MFAHKTTARVIGVLFVVASATAIAGGFLLLPLAESDYLVATAAAEGQIVSGVLIELILVMSVIAIAVMMYPLLKRQNEGLALGYVGARTLEGVLLLAASVSGLLVLSLAQDYGVAGAADVQALGDSLLAARDWTYLLGSMAVFGVTALILNSLLYRSRLVPTWLSVWGLLGGGLIVLRGLIGMYGADLTGLMQGLFVAPIAVQEMVFAIWLIIKGFNTSGLPGVGLEKPARRELEGLATTKAPV
ncbi:MAG: DUF4386 domain-containing protein [Acidimicrobiia bacterium]